MCTVRIGKFIQEYAAVYLTAGLENILAWKMIMIIILMIIILFPVIIPAITIITHITIIFIMTLLPFRRKH